MGLSRLQHEGQGIGKASSEAKKEFQDVRAKYKNKRLLAKPKEGATSPQRLSKGGSKDDLPDFPRDEGWNLGGRASIEAIEPYVRTKDKNFNF